LLLPPPVIRLSQFALCACTGRLSMRVLKMAEAGNTGQAPRLGPSPDAAGGVLTLPPLPLLPPALPPLLPALPADPLSPPPPHAPSMPSNRAAERIRSVCGGKDKADRTDIGILRTLPALERNPSFDAIVMPERRAVRRIGLAPAGRAAKREARNAFRRQPPCRGLPLHVR
jgi:hypothetical protein